MSHIILALVSQSSINQSLAKEMRYAHLNNISLHEIRQKVFASKKDPSAVALADTSEFTEFTDTLDSSSQSGASRTDEEIALADFLAITAIEEAADDEEEKKQQEEDEE